jgi:hypothetical protein
LTGFQEGDDAAFICRREPESKRRRQRPCKADTGPAAETVTAAVTTAKAVT